MFTTKEVTPRRTLPRPEKGPYQGLNVPEEVPAIPGVFYPVWEWMYVLNQTVLNSANRDEVFKHERLGPRGGWWSAIVSEEKWAAWRTKYIQRVEARTIGETESALDPEGTLERRKKAFAKRAGIK